MDDTSNRFYSSRSILYSVVRSRELITERSEEGLRVGPPPPLPCHPADFCVVEKSHEGGGQVNLLFKTHSDLPAPEKYPERNSL